MIAAIIVLYHPDLKAVARLLDSLDGQVDTVLAIDNTPGSAPAKLEFIEEFKSEVSYIPLGDNKGIAAAQNVGIQACIKAGFTHVLLLDQDSELSVGMTERFLAAENELLKSGELIAALCPQIIDKRTGSRPIAVYYRFGIVRKVWANTASYKTVITDNFIASGSLLRVDALQALGLMREDLFIEYVDTEWALRASSAGYKSYCVPDAVLFHNFGDASAKILGKDIYLYSDIRYHYKLRNEVFISRLRTMGWQWRFYAFLHIPYHFLLYSAISKNSLRTSRVLLKAMWDGWQGRIGPLTEASATDR